MKAIMLCFAFFILTSNGYCQVNAPELQLSKDAYLKKSKAQKQTAWTLLGVGTASMGAGWLLASSLSGDVGQDVEEGYYGALLFTGGLIVDLVSIPFFTASTRNKKRAMKAVTSIKFEEVPSWSGGAVRQSNALTLSMQVRF